MILTSHANTITGGKSNAYDASTGQLTDTWTESAGGGSPLASLSTTWTQYAYDNLGRLQTVTAKRRSRDRGRPFGEDAWVRRTAKALNLDRACDRSAGRESKKGVGAKSMEICFDPLPRVRLRRPTR